MKKVILLTLICAVALIGLTGCRESEEKELEDSNESYLTYSELINQIEYAKIEKIKIRNGSSTVKIKQCGSEDEKKVKIPSMEAFEEYLQEEINKGNNFIIEKK